MVAGPHNRNFILNVYKLYMTEYKILYIHCIMYENMLIIIRYLLLYGVKKVGHKFIMSCIKIESILIYKCMKFIYTMYLVFALYPNVTLVYLKRFCVFRVYTMLKKYIYTLLQPKTIFPSQSIAFQHSIFFQVCIREK